MELESNDKKIFFLKTEDGQDEYRSVIPLRSIPWSFTHKYSSKAI